MTAGGGSVRASNKGADVGGGMAYEGTALGVPAARMALSEYRKRAWTMVLGGACGGVFGVVTGLTGITWTPLWWAIGCAMVGGMLLFRATRIRTLLERHPWRERRVVHVGGGRLRPVVVVEAGERGEVWPLAVELPFQQQVDLREHSSVVWTAGDPRFGVVVSPPGGDRFRLASPARGRRLRGVAAVPEVRASAGRLLTDARPAVRRPKVFRWVLLLGAACFLYAAVGSENSGDAEVGLTVLDRGPGGNCVVRFDDPFTGEEREESYHCDEGGDADLRNFETGRVVSRWPGRAVLYNEKYQEPPSGDDLFDVVGNTGLGLVPLAVVGAVAGRLLHLRRWRRAMEMAGNEPSAPATAETATAETATGKTATEGEGTEGAGAAPTSVGRAQAGRPSAPARVPALNHAGAVARAERFAPRPEPAIWERDWRTAPWWRVRGLRLIVGEGELYAWLFGQLGALLAVVCLAVFLHHTPSWAPALMVLGALAVAWSGRDLYRRLPAIRALRDAAATPGPRRRRYVLLPTTPRVNGEAQRLLLVVFPEEGGDEALPEGLLEVQAPGTKRHPWAGLPAPAGTVELHGPPAGGGQEAPVVPVIGGLVLWPVGRYEEIGPDGRDRRGLLADVEVARA